MISNFGRVKTLPKKHKTMNQYGNSGTRTAPERIRKPNILAGYHCITLFKNGKAKGYKIHRLVAEAFIGPQPDPTYQIDHIDGNKANNHVSNLEWVTPKENTNRAIKNGQRKPYTEKRRKAIGEKLKMHWQNTEYRERQSQKAKAAWSGDGVREYRSRRIAEGIRESKSKRYLHNREGDMN